MALSTPIRRTAPAPTRATIIWSWRAFPRRGSPIVPHGSFGSGSGENGRPIWTSDITRRGAVFTYAGNCRRSDVVYNPGSARYFLALSYDAAGNWGLFDAPEPWGPWTVVLHDEGWGIPGTHGYRLPAKWISRDGLTMTLVFSGIRQQDTTYDAFCTRTMRLLLR